MIIEINEIFKTMLVISAIISIIGFIALGWQIINAAEQGKNLNDCKLHSLYVCFISVIFAIASFIGGTITEQKIRDDTIEVLKNALANKDIYFNGDRVEQGAIDYEVIVNNAYDYRITDKEVYVYN